MGVDKKRKQSRTSYDYGHFKVSAWGYRHQQCVILFFCLTTAYSMRACMGVSLVAMTAVYHKDQHTVNNITINDNNTVGYNNTDELQNVDVNNNITVNGTNEEENEFETHGILNVLLLTPPYPQFKWDKKIQDTILASFSWGYMVLQLPAGQLAHRFGTRYLLSGALIINGVVSFLLPWMTYYGGWPCAVICRVLTGLSQACIVPSLHTAFGKWAPLEERGRLSAFAYGGQALGTVIGLPITGFLASSVLGWPGIFRFYGILSSAVAILLWCFLADTPAQHKSISPGERRYIEEALGQTETAKKRPVPWRALLRSRGLWAIVIGHIGQTWGQVTLYNEVPAYMANVMGVNIKANGLLSALPFLVMWFANFFFSWFTDMLIVKKILSVGNTRKLANSIGCVPSALGLVALTLVPKNIYVIETVLVLICSFKISAHVGCMINHIDISPNYAGTLMSISNFSSNTVASFCTIVAGFILTDPTQQYLWNRVFYIAAGFYFVSNLLYVLMGTGEVASWNDIGDDDGEKEAVPMLEKVEKKERTQKDEKTHK